MVGGGLKLMDVATDGMGIDSLMGLSADAGAAGFMVQMQMGTEGEATFGFEPMEVRTVSCDEIASVLFPHLTGQREVVVAESRSGTMQPDGSVLHTPVLCRWEGSPKKGSPTATVGSAASSPAVEVEPSAMPDVPQGGEASPSVPEVPPVVPVVPTEGASPAP
jgi:hypothetical protein